MTIEQLAARVAALPLDDRGHRRYDAALKRDLRSALASSGLSNKEFGQRVGVPGVNFTNWGRERRRARPSVKASRPSKPAFKAVTVEPERRWGMRVVAANGVVIEDLSVEALADLLAALSRRASC